MDSFLASDVNRVIVGAGVTGESIARFLLRQGAEFSLVDTRNDVEISPGLLATQAERDSIFRGREACQSLVADADDIYLSPGIAVEDFSSQYQLKKGAEITGDLSLFMQFADAPIVLITGSNAKTTVTTLVGEMARDAGINVGVGGNIGMPMLDLLSGDFGLYVLEISSFQLERCKQLHSEVATVLNVAEDHLDRHGDIEHYAAIKRKIYQGAKHIIYNADDHRTYPDNPCQLAALTTRSFGFNGSTDGNICIRLNSHNSELDIVEKETPLLSVEKIKLIGKHNISNVMAALSIGRALGISPESMGKTIATFSGLAHRCEFVSTIGGVKYINDSKATNVGATVAAIRGLCGESSVSVDRKLVLIAGGVTKQADFSDLASALEGIDCLLVLIGEGADEIAAACEHQSSIRANSMIEAVRLAAEHAVFGDIVLLSPACASFDMFSDFEERGEAFKSVVLDMTGHVSSEGLA